MFCNKCGHEIKENEIFCIKCGNKVEFDSGEPRSRNRVVSLSVKKIALVIAGVVLIGAIAGGIIASQYKDDAEISMSEPVVEETVTEDEFAGQILPALELINSCEVLEYGAEVDYYTSYTAWFSNMADAEDADLDECVIFDECSYPEEHEGYYATEYILGYNPVYNFNSIEEINDNLHLNFSNEFISEMDYEGRVIDQFVEYNGELYFLQAAIGFNARYDVDSVKYQNIEDGRVYYQIDYLVGEEYDHTETVEFVREEGRWVLNDIY